MRFCPVTYLNEVIPRFVVHVLFARCVFRNLLHPRARLLMIHVSISVRRKRIPLAVYCQFIPPLQSSNGRRGRVESGLEAFRKARLAPRF